MYRGDCSARSDQRKIADLKTYAMQNFARFAASLAADPAAAPGRVAKALSTKSAKAMEGALAASGLGRTIWRNYRGKGVAVMFHEIHADVEAGLRTGCSPGQLRFVLTRLKAEGRDFVTVEEAMRRLLDPAARDFAVVTFDDGYRDNRDLALPVLEEFGAPMTLFVPTGMITRNIDAWWLGIRELLTRFDAIDMEPMNRRLTAADAPSRNAALRDITLWIGTDQARTDALQPVFARHGIHVADLVDRLAFTQDELKALARHPLVTIGGHTSTHRFLARLPEGEAYEDIASNRAYLEALVGAPVTAFAYPYGSAGACGAREAAMVDRAGYTAAFTTRLGHLFPQHREHPHLLPREDLGGAYMPGAEIAGRLEGWRRALKRAGAGPIATLD